MKKPALVGLSCLTLSICFAAEAPADFPVADLPRGTILTFTQAQTLSRLREKSLETQDSSLNEEIFGKEVLGFLNEFQKEQRLKSSTNFFGGLFKKQIETTDKTYFVSLKRSKFEVADSKLEVNVNCFLLGSAPITDKRQIAIDVNRSLQIKTDTQASLQEAERTGAASGSIPIYKMEFDDEPRNFFDELVCELDLGNLGDGPLLRERGTFSVSVLKKMYPDLTVDLPEESFR
jgi:hypothetical protein